jgi:hypothetical protein
MRCSGLHGVVERTEGCAGLASSAGLLWGGQVCSAAGDGAAVVRGLPPAGLRGPEARERRAQTVWPAETPKGGASRVRARARTRGCVLRPAALWKRCCACEGGAGGVGTEGVVTLLPKTNRRAFAQLRPVCRCKRPVAARRRASLLATASEIHESPPGGVGRPSPREPNCRPPSRSSHRPAAHRFRQS